jgi:hypothetical protein
MCGEASRLLCAGDVFLLLCTQRCREGSTVQHKDAVCYKGSGVCSWHKGRMVQGWWVGSTAHLRVGRKTVTEDDGNIMMYSGSTLYTRLVYQDNGGFPCLANLASFFGWLMRCIDKAALLMMCIRNIVTRLVLFGLNVLDCEEHADVVQISGFS